MKGNFSLNILVFSGYLIGPHIEIWRFKKLSIFLSIMEFFLNLKIVKNNEFVTQKIHNIMKFCIKRRVPIG